MAATVVPSVMVNLKALNQYNYEHWSFRVKTYLLAEGLWDLVQDTDAAQEISPSASWQQKNAKALHAIHISCGDDAESSISGIETAREAWSKLAEKFKFKPFAFSDIIGKNSEVGPDDDSDSGSPLVEVSGTNTSRGHYTSFFHDVRAGRWEDVSAFIIRDPEAVRATEGYVTALGRAVSMEDMNGVKELLRFIKDTNFKTLENALSMAIMNDDTDVTIEIIKCIIEKNKKLLVRGVSVQCNRSIPLLMALHFGKPKMARYLYAVTPLKNLKMRHCIELLFMSLRVNRLDISLELLQQNSSLVDARDHSGESPLNQLASTRARLFLDASQLGIWERCIYNCISIPPTPTPTRDVSIDVQKEEKDQGNQQHLIRKVACSFGGLLANLCHRSVPCSFGGLVANLCHRSGIYRIYQMKLLHHQALEILDRMCEPLRQNKNEEVDNSWRKQLVEKALFKAVERGHATIISHILKSDASFYLITNEHKKTIFQLAAEHRQDDIFKLLYGFDKRRRTYIVGMQDKFGDNMLHAVGKFSPLTQIGHIRGPALQMQKELQWFKKVERMASPKVLDCMNSDGRTPGEVFTINHRDLVEAGEKSMKETATSSSALVAALIITIMFAAVVTVPGGIKGETGIPTYLNTKAFGIFIVADVISLCSSTTSVMVFLGILTSRFAEEDFLISLPRKLMIGFLTLFLSIGAMMIAFSSAIFIMLPEKPSIVIPSFVLASIPIVSFLRMQFPFLVEIIKSTYGFWRFRVFKRKEAKFELH